MRNIVSIEKLLVEIVELKKQAVKDKAVAKYYLNFVFDNPDRAEFIKATMVLYNLKNRYRDQLKKIKKECRKEPKSYILASFLLGIIDLYGKEND